MLPLEQAEDDHADVLGLSVELKASAPPGRMVAAGTFGTDGVFAIATPDEEQDMVPINLVTIHERVVTDAAFAE